MPARPLIATALAVLLGACAPAGLGAAGPTLLQAAASDAPTGFALLELFTSEGCSDTPPAERVLNRIADDAVAGDRRVFALAYHVPYWDHLGWKDVYAAKLHQDRQWAYARALGRANVYTPQVLLDGRADLRWHDDQASRDALAASLGRPAAARLTLAAERQAVTSALRVTYTVADAPAGAVLQLALAERGIVTDVERGENAGKRLAHAPVVRAFSTVDAAAGQATVDAPAGIDWSRASVVAFVQDPVTMAIAGAARLDLAAVRP